MLSRARRLWRGTTIGKIRDIAASSWLGSLPAGTVGPLAALTLGFFGLQAWINRLYGGMGPMPTLPDPASYISYFGSMYALVGVAAGLAMLLCAAFWRVADRLLALRGTRFAAAGLMIFGTVSVAFTAGDASSWVSVQFIGGCVVGCLGWALLSIEYFLTLGRFPLAGIMVAVGVPIVASMVLSLSFHPSSQTVNALVTLAFPLISAAALPARRTPADDELAPLHPGAAAAGEAGSRVDTQLRHTFYLLITCVALWQMGNKLAHTVYSGAYGTGMALPALSSVQPLTVVFSIAFVLVVGAYFLLRRQPVRFSVVYRAFFFLALAGTLGLGVTVHQGIAPVFYSLNGAVFRVVDIVFLPILAYMSSRLGRPTRTVGIGGGVWMLGSAVGIALGTGVLDLWGHAAANVATAASIVTALTIAVTYTSVCSERDVDVLADSLPAHRRPFRERCQEVSVRYGLSPRETDVLYLIATGKDMPAMQKELVLSKSTISTHREHLYKKMGIHSKAELVELVETLS